MKHSKMEKKTSTKKAPAKKSGSKMSNLTPAQKKLPPFIQAAIAKKKKKK
jgi:hypothetical protein